MKHLFILSALFLTLAVSSYTTVAPALNAGSAACDKTPPLNQKLIDYIKTVVNKQVGRGECWDLAAQGLNTIGATWDKSYGFGKEIDPKKECVYPGDIIQFERVEIQYQEKDTFYKVDMEHHTAVIFKVNSKESFVMAEQNTTSLGKKVGFSNLELRNILKGTYKVFRPVK